MDVGGNMGSLAFGMAHAVGYKSLVYVIEPGPVLFRRLKKNIGLNKSLEGCFSPHELGSSDKHESRQWIMDVESNYGNAMFTENFGIPMQMTTLDDFAAAHNISYNTEHRHGALGLMTPQHPLRPGHRQVATACRGPARRLRASPEALPARGADPTPLPTAAWINKPLAPPALVVPEAAGS